MPSPSGYPPVFADPQLESDFTREGYVVLPLLDEESVQRLLSLFNDTVSELPSAFFATGMGSDLERRKLVGEGMYEVLGPLLARLMPNFTVITGRNFVVKRGADSASHIPMHQDLTFVDQNVERGVHVWIPLVDVNHANGCLKVSPKSHRLTNDIAAVGKLTRTYDAIRPIFEEDCTVSVPMKAGEALFFDERMMHGSEPNTVPAVRPAAHIALVRTGTKQRVYFANDETPGVFDIYEIDHEFAMQYGDKIEHRLIDPNSARKIGTVAYRAESLTEADLEPVRVRRTKGGASAAPTGIVSAKPVPSAMPPMPPRPSGFLSRLFGGRA